MSEQVQLTTEQKDRMLTEIYHAVAGHPMDPNRPGLVAIVATHQKTLFGEKGNNGLVGQAKKVQRWMWMAVGFGAALNIGLAIKLALLSAGK